MHEKKQVNDPGMPQYFHGKSGLEFLETTQTLCSCIVSLKDFENLATNDTTCGQIAAAVSVPTNTLLDWLRSGFKSSLRILHFDWVFTMLRKNNLYKSFLITVQPFTYAIAHAQKDPLKKFYWW